jgi:hypothetical protein
MATSVKLKACGGIGPYTWSKTGGLVLSNTTGIKVIVTAEGANEFEGQTAFVDVRGLTTRPADAPGEPSGSVSCFNTTWLCYDCLGVFIAQCDIRSNFNNTDIYYLEGTSGDCSTPYSESGTGSGGSVQHSTCLAQSCTAKVHIVWNARGLDYTTPSLEVPVATNNITVIEANVDLRSQAMIDGGCAPCGNTGTVTVTDGAGVSVSYVF